MLTTISFPGLGIDKFTINPVAFTIPLFDGIEVRWYGILITIGIILAFIYCAYRTKQEGIIFDDLLDVAIFTVIFGVIGARAGYVLFSLDKYLQYLDSEGGFLYMLKKMVSINEGGLQIYGAVIVGAITILIVCKKKKINALKMLDSAAPAVMIGQIIGRWGNFCNGEAHGSIVEQGNPLYFIRMGLDTHNIEGVRGMAEVHPTFLYESLWNLIGFILINLFYKKKKFNGQITLMYLAWYGFGRMFIEMLRTDQLKVGIFPVSVVIGFVCFVGGTILLIIGFIQARRTELTAGEYIPTYAKISHYGENIASVTNNESTVNETVDTPEASEEPQNNDTKEEDKDEILKKLSSLSENESNDKE